MYNFDFINLKPTAEQRHKNRFYIDRFALRISVFWFIEAGGGYIDII